MSLFTRLGSCSVRRRINRVFPKPPRCDETTRTESLKKKNQYVSCTNPHQKKPAISNYTYFEPYRSDHTTGFLFLKSFILGTETSVSLNKTLLQTLLLSPVFKGKFFFLDIFYLQGYLQKGGSPVLISRNISENLLFWV